MNSCYTTRYRPLSDAGRRNVMAVLGRLAIWRNLWSDGEDLARHARTFIANHLTAAGAS